MYKKIAIGTRNALKARAIEELIKQYSITSHAKVELIPVSSDVPKQPTDIEQVIRGAKNRARNAMCNGDLGIGIEDGITRVPGTNTGYVNFCCCTICDGTRHYFGFSSGFEYPPRVIRRVLEEGMDINKAFFAEGLSVNDDIGSLEGAIGFLSKGRIKRKDTIKQAFIMAMIQLENRTLYEAQRS